MRWVRAAAVATALMVNLGALSGLTGCGSSQSSQTAQEHALTVVGTQGGSVTTSDGSGVTIPAGAVPANVTITVDATPSAPTPSQGTAVGTPYTFGPEGQQFSVPVTVTLAFDPTLLPAGKTASDIVIYTAPAGTTAYTPLGTSVVDTTHAAAQTTHFSTFVCLIPLQIHEDSGTTPLDASAGPDSSLLPPSDAATGDDGGSVTVDSSGPPQDATTGEDGGSSATDSGAGATDGGLNTFDSGSPEDATLGGDGGFSGQDGGSAGQSDATTGNVDSGSGQPQDASTPTDASAASDASSCNLGAALGANIVPLQTIAGLNMNEQGPSTASLAYATATLCGAGTFGGQEDAGADQGTTIENWAGGSISAQVNDPSSQLPNLIQTITVQGSYTGSLSFTSRSNGAFGNHSYKITVSQITRDGSLFPVAWDGNPNAAVNELGDAMLATFAPSYPAETACTATGSCLAYDANGGDPDAGVSGSVFGVRPLKMYVTMNDDNTVLNLYTFFAGSFAVPDAGVPGVSGDGGITVPAGCSPQVGNGVYGSCEDPVAAFCSNFPSDVLYSCQDAPQSGYTMVCCPPDAGP